MMGPVGSTANVPNKGIRLAAKNWKKIALFATDVLGLYNMMSPKPVAMEALSTFCAATFHLCNDIAKLAFGHDGVDNAKLLPLAAQHVPSGAGWRTFVYWAQ